MDNYTVAFHPRFEEMAAELAELDEERTCLALLMGNEAFERVREIVEAQPREKWAAFYGTIREAVCGGADFSGVRTLDDIGAEYARYVIDKMFR